MTDLKVQLFLNTKILHCTTSVFWTPEIGFLSIESPDYNHVELAQAPNPFHFCAILRENYIYMYQMVSLHNRSHNRVDVSFQRKIKKEIIQISLCATLHFTFPYISLAFIVGS